MDTKINLRIDKDLKETLEDYALDEGKNLSEYIRDVLEDHIELKKDDFDDALFPVISVVSLTNDFEKSYEFTYLLTWLFSKYMYPVDKNSKDSIRVLKEIVEKVISKSSFSQELKMEFVKVLNDINRFLVESDYEGKQFYFSIYNNQSSFNYNLLMNEIWSKK
ncbi:ribbon-helix-helix protein, CopG family [Winogradskyella sp.]|uniref:ribbon-helix-helix protein, CopG family n=1 Tax=Winogradskyella sp. TaxID=1883156 RepID=UPI003AB87C00